MAFRLDSIRLDTSKIQRTPAGMVRVDAVIARSDVFTYTDPDGRKVREWLPPEELARADSLASAADVTVTRRHPSEMVTPKTWPMVSIGHVSGVPTASPEGARATLVIAREDAQASIGKDLVEVSRGVNVRIDETPGVTPDGKPYDRVQRDIVYNHIALGPPGWGRQGASVSLRLDSAGDELFESEQQTMKITTKDGKVLEFKTDSELQAYYDGLSASPTRTDAFPPKPKAGDEDEDEEKKKAKKDAADAQARADAEKARADAATAELAKIKRAELEASARKVLGAEAKFDAAGADGKPVPMTDRAVRELVIKRLDSNAKLDGESDEYVRVRYDVELSKAPTSSNRQDQISTGLRGVRVDGSPQPGEAPKIRADIKLRQDAQDAWKKNTGAALTLK